MKLTCARRHAIADNRGRCFLANPIISQRRLFKSCWSGVQTQVQEWLQIRAWSINEQYHPPQLIVALPLKSPFKVERAERRHYGTTQKGTFSTHNGIDYDWPRLTPFAFLINGTCRSKRPQRWVVGPRRSFGTSLLRHETAVLGNLQSSTKDNAIPQNELLTSLSRPVQDLTRKEVAEDNSYQNRLQAIRSDARESSKWQKKAHKPRGNGRIFDAIWRRRSYLRSRQSKVAKFEGLTATQSMLGISTKLDFAESWEPLSGKSVTTSSLIWISDSPVDHGMSPLEDYLLEILSKANPGIDKSNVQRGHIPLAFATSRGLDPGRQHVSATGANEQHPYKPEQATVIAPTKMSLMRVLAGYIDLQLRKPHLTPRQYDQLLLDVFSLEKLTYLHETMYEVEDIVAWAWILQDISDLGAVLRFLMWTNRSPPARQVPRFILAIIMQRDLKDPLAIQLLVRHMWHRLANRLDESWTDLHNGGRTTNIGPKNHGNKDFKLSDMIAESLSDETQLSGSFDTTGTSRSLEANYHQIRPDMVGWMNRQLVRLALAFVPSLLPNITTMLCRYCLGKNEMIDLAPDGHSFDTVTRLTEVFNTALVGLAWRTKEPYTTVPYQERAQFIILRYMHEFNPSLTVNTDAYRAIISVQLRHRKTIKERIWAKLKSRAWPPYREDKLGLDATKKSAIYGISRAQRAIINRQEAGYAPTEWENTASILSGWDTDRSPTIQTKQLLVYRSTKSNQADSDTETMCSVWEARIQATRTVEEAWASFLRYMGQPDFEPIPKVFLAMFEKLIRDQRRKPDAPQSNDVPEGAAVPGDMPETWPSSPNPRDMVYTTTPLPTSDNFYQRYRSYFPILDTYTLNFLLRKAETLQQGLGFIYDSDLDAEDKALLLGFRQLNHRTRPKIQLTTITSYVSLLSRFPTEPLQNSSNNVRQVSALSHAVELLKWTSPSIRGPWVFLLQGLRSVVGRPRRGLFIASDWRLMEEILWAMKRAGVGHDSETFYSLCVIYNRLMWMISVMQDKYSQSLDVDARIKDLLLDTGNSKSVVKLVKGLFSRMISTSLKPLASSFLPLHRQHDHDAESTAQFNAASFLPHLLYVPSAATLHMFARFLGIYQDKQAILELLQWMSTFNDEIQVKVHELSGGQRHFRWTLVAARIGLEASTRPFISRESLADLKQRKGSRIEIQQARSIIETIPSWGGWPTDEEVESYLETHMHRIEALRAQA